MHNFVNSGDADSSRVDFYRVNLAANQTITVRAISSAFSPAILISGPGFDSNGNLLGSAWERGLSDGDTTVTTLTASDGGIYTVAVGTNPQIDAFGTNGAYTIDIEPNPPLAASLLSASAPRRVKR